MTLEILFFEDVETTLLYAENVEGLRIGKEEIVFWKRGCEYKPETVLTKDVGRVYYGNNKVWLSPVLIERMHKEEEERRRLETEKQEKTETFSKKLFRKR